MNIKGITIKNKNIVMSQFDDDTSIILDDSDIPLKQHKDNYKTMM